MGNKITVLGTGLVGRPMALDLISDFDVRVVDFNEKRLSSIPCRDKLALDLSKKENVHKAIADADIVLNAVPGFMGYFVTKTVIEAGKNLVDISFFPENPDELIEIAKKMEVTAIIDCGVAPGLSYILAGYAHHLLDLTDSVEIYVGGLPKKKDHLWDYKAVFSPADVIEEYTRPARIKVNNQIVTKDALTDLEEIEFEGIGTLEAFNTDGLRSLLNTIDCPEMIEKTLRYPGYCSKIKFLKDSGFFNTSELEIGGTKFSPLEATSQILFPLWELKPGDEDITVMLVKVKGKMNGAPKVFEWTLTDEYNRETQIHSMARTTGYTATAVVRMISQRLFTQKGLFFPEQLGNKPVLVDFILSELKKRKIVFK